MLASNLNDINLGGSLLILMINFKATFLVPQQVPIILLLNSNGSYKFIITIRNVY